MASRVHPLVVGVLQLALDGLELALLLLLDPEVPDLFAAICEDLVLVQLCKPGREPRKVLGLVEELGPAKDSREHELHEYCRRVPSHVCQRDLGTAKVRALHALLKPLQLRPDLCELRRTCGLVHASLLLAPLRLVGRQVHRTLCVREAWLGAVGRSYVEVVYSAQEVLEGPPLWRVRPRHRQHPSELVLEVVQDDCTLKDDIPLIAHKGGLSDSQGP
eukprot:UN0689